jgi:hypothetical protein
MPTPTLPPEWEVLLAPFQSLFTKPGFRYFCAFVFVFAHLDRRLWVTQVILSGLLERHWTNFYRFLDSPAWSPKNVREKVFALGQAVAMQPGGRLLVAVDDTVARKTGQHFDGAGWHHDPMHQAHPKRLSYGHCFVCLALLAQPQAGQWVALFLGAALYVQKRACQKDRPFATKLALAVSLFAELVAPENAVVIAVGDGAYAKRSFVRPLVASCQHVLSRLRRDAVFYDLPPERPLLPSGKYAPGRPRQYGAKRKAADWAEQTDGWAEATLCLYGKPTRVRLKTCLCKQRAFATTMRLVAVQWEGRPTVFLFCTDPRLTAEEIVLGYCARFAIETGFRESKQQFGLTTYQVRKETRFVRLVNLCLWAQTLLRLSLWKARPQAFYGAWRKPLGYLTLAQQKRLSQSQNGISAGSFTERPAARNTEPEAMAAGEPARIR